MSNVYPVFLLLSKQIIISVLFIHDTCNSICLFSIKMYLLNTEQREHLKLLRENSPEGDFYRFVEFVVSFYVLIILTIDFDFPRTFFSCHRDM